MHQQANGCTQHNGASASTTNDDYDDEIATSSSSHHRNGNIADDYNADATTPIMGKTDQDIVRLIGQHLKTIGLK